MSSWNVVATPVCVRQTITIFIEDLIVTHTATVAAEMSRTIAIPSAMMNPTQWMSVADFVIRQLRGRLDQRTIDETTFCVSFAAQISLLMFTMVFAGDASLSLALHDAIQIVQILVETNFGEFDVQIVHFVVLVAIVFVGAKMQFFLHHFGCVHTWHSQSGIVDCGFDFAQQILGQIHQALQLQRFFVARIFSYIVSLLFAGQILECANIHLCIVVPLTQLNLLKSGEKRKLKKNC